MAEFPSTDRRQFLRYGIGGIAIASTSHVVLARDGITVGTEPEELANDLTTEVDVVVVGGGTAGTVAAIQAGRAGARTLLLERSGQLGGMTTVGGVCYPGLFDAWGKQIIAGIGWELVRESVELDGGTLPDFAKVPARHWQNQVTVNQFVYSILAEEKCVDAGVEIAYHEFIQGAKATPAGWELNCAGFGTNRLVRCKQIIDCTGGAEVVGLLGFERMREDETQPGSYLFQLGGNHEVGRKQLHQIYVHGADSTNSRTVTEAKLAGRKLVLKKLRDAKGQKRLMHLQPEPGFRESYRIVGETMITVNDYTSGRKFDDAVCNAFYPVDLHTKHGVKPKPLKPGTVPTIPLSALIPKGSRNIIVAGRSLSSDRLANSGLRVQAPCMAMGQAAACAAALAAKDGTTPGEVPLERLHALLQEHGAIIPDKA
ncbi:FAD-dependent oxidoreductase [Haloferula sp. A504]|uniref:FAD-dependent oxidoreductase n=1 Tax=Haloferula sp. A504 TaxID=3373601 RepID=UPI0031BBF1C3|nr:FAD-dependent oxidoreductase [Verrucomicrobiaceae bacterium E54]